MSHQDHARAAEAIVARCAVVTLSDTRTEQTDSSGAAIAEMLIQAGHQVLHRQILRDEPADLRAALDALLSRADIDAIITNGGTGVSPRDGTIEVVQPLLDLPLPGFGELFRMLSHQQIGSAAMLSRAAGGIARGKPLFALPGSTKAVELALRELIIPQLRHLLGQLRRGK